VKVQRLQSEVTLILDADEPAAVAVFDTTKAQKFVDEFHFMNFGLKATESTRGLMWIGVQGEVNVGRDALVAIPQAQGTQVDLTVGVDGDSTDADRALDAIWRSLCQLDAAPVRPADDLGTRCYQTTAIVDLDTLFEDLFPTARFLRERVVQEVEKTPFHPPERIQHRFAFDLPLSLGGYRRVDRQFVLEPRTNAKSERVLYSKSPLRSETHLAILKELIERPVSPVQP
jgi:hypothetical protein